MVVQTNNRRLIAGANTQLKQTAFQHMKVSRNFAAVLFLWLIAFDIRAAVTFTNTPAAVSNTWQGYLTYQIAGIPTGDTVVIQKYLDVNTNGVVDSSDILLQQFQLTDGQGPPVFSGVTNLDVPGDLNPAVGAITAEVNFADGDFVQTLAGHYLIVLSSPAGHFTSITNFFTVTNLPYPQVISGSAVSNGTATVVPNAVVLLFPAPRPGHDIGTPVGGAVANNSGVYSIPVPTGTYVPVALKTNFVSDYSVSPVLTLSNNQTITTNLSLKPGASTITGKLVDASTNSIGIPGSFLPVMRQSPDILLSPGFTDTNGNFSFDVSSGNWSFGTADGSILHGYLEFNNSSTNASAGASGVLDEIPKETAIFYGTVKDILGNPLPGIAIAAEDETNNGIYYTDSYTDTNGNYFAAALGGISDDLWQVQIDHAPANYVFSQASSQQIGGIPVNVGDAIQQNLTAIAATSQIYGHVQDNFGNPIVGVGIYASATISDISFNTDGNDNTDSNGNFVLNVPNGFWSVGINTGGGDNSLNGNYEQVPNQFVNISGFNGVANFTVQTNVNQGGSLQVTTSSLPSGIVGGVYDQELNADGDDNATPYYWEVVSGSLPPGISMDEYGAGFLAGIPTATGTYHFTVEVYDQNSGQTATSLSITINPGPALNPLSWSTNRFQMLFSGQTSQNYTIQVATNAASPVWTTLFATNNTVNGSFIVVDPNATNRQRIYRAIEAQ